MADVHIPEREQGLFYWPGSRHKGPTAAYQPAETGHIRSSSQSASLGKLSQVVKRGKTDSWNIVCLCQRGLWRRRVPRAAWLRLVRTASSSLSLCFLCYYGHSWCNAASSGYRRACRASLGPCALNRSGESRRRCRSSCKGWSRTGEGRHFVPLSNARRHPREMELFASSPRRAPGPQATRRSGNADEEPTWRAVNSSSRGRSANRRRSTWAESERKRRQQKGKEWTCENGDGM